MRTHLVSCVLALSMIQASGCGDDDKGSSSSATTTNDAGSGGSETDAQVAYQGVTRGGVIRTGDELPPPEADQGPFVVSDECCTRTVAIEADGNETSVRVVGNQPPFDGEGVTPTLASGRYSADVCIPVGLAVQYHFEVQVPGDGGSETVVRPDPYAPTIEDENGTVWNLAILQTCDPDAGIPDASTP